MPLWAPYYGISFLAAYARYWKKYVSFDGRASRSEYWWVAVANGIITLIVDIPLTISTTSAAVTAAQNGDTVAHMGAGSLLLELLLWAWGLANLLPGLGLTVRRLHDGGRSGAWIFIALIPLVGPIWLLVLTIVGSSPTGARFDRPTSAT